MEKNEIQKLCSYLHRVTDKVEKHVQTLRSQMEQGVISWDECEQLAEASNLAEWIGCQVHQVEGLAKEQRFSFGYLYRCKKSDPLETVKAGRLYRLRKWHNTFIVCGEGFAISERVMPEYFERVMEEEDKK
jgi:hypothetical protein